MTCEITHTLCDVPVSPETNMASNSTHFPTSTRDIFLTKFIAKIFPMHYTCMLTRTPVLHPNKNDNNNISKNRNIHR